MLLTGQYNVICVCVCVCERETINCHGKLKFSPGKLVENSWKECLPCCKKPELAYISGLIASLYNLIISIAVTPCA